MEAEAHIFITPEQYAIAEKNGIARNTVYNRVNSYDYTVERAITEPVKKVDPEKKKWRNIAKKNGIKPNQFHTRVYMGWEYERAATQPVVPPHERRFLTDEQAALAKKNGISKDAVYARVKTYGWEMEEALTKPISKGEK